MTLGDLEVVGECPPKLMKALAVIASELHPSYDRSPDAQPGFSKEACLFSSLAVRDFLVEIGFKDATVRTVACLVKAFDRQGKEIHSVGVGVPGQQSRPDKFNGHAVVTVPSAGLLIDTTLYTWDRPAWSGNLSGMIAAPYIEPDGDTRRIYDRPAISAMSKECDDRTLHMIWLDRPEINWKREPDFRQKNARRISVTRALREKFGEWQDK